MRYNIDLINERQFTDTPKIEVKDRILDPYLIYRISKCGDENYELIKSILLSNPFTYEKKDLPINLDINYIDDFCFRNGKDIFTLGGLSISKEYSKKQKKYYIKKCFEKWEGDFIASQRLKVEEISNQLAVVDKKSPKYVKLFTLIIYLLISVLLLLIFFPNEKILNINIVGKYIEKFNNFINENNKKIVLKYICFSSTLFTTFFIIIYNIFSKIFFKKYKEVFSKIDNLTKVVSKKSKKTIRKIRKKYIKMAISKKHQFFKLSEILDKKYRLSTIEEINKKSFKKLNLIKKIINKMYVIKWIIYGLNIIAIILFIASLIYFS